MSLPSRYQIGEVHKVNFNFEQLDNRLTDKAIPCRILGVSFDGAKVRYDLELLLNDEYTTVIYFVDSYFMQD